MSDQRSYKDDEVRAIIERALKEQQPQSGGVSHEDLLAIGGGVGLSPAAIESAVREEREGRLTATATARVVARRRRGVAAHALVFALVNALLFAINFLTTPGEWWVLFSVFGWGLGLALHAGFGLSSQVSERRLEREKRRLQPTLAAPDPAGERRTGVRVAGPLDQIEDPSEPEAGSTRVAR